MKNIFEGVDNELLKKLNLDLMSKYVISTIQVEKILCECLTKDEKSEVFPLLEKTFEAAYRLGVDAGKSMNS